MSSLNISVLGHVDCGKTTLTRRIAEVASTLAFDKHAEKGGRHNTLDLGFSSLHISNRRIALIDCPGHAALIRAVLAASTVFDMAIVVIDASSGVQAQTAEHLLLCSIFCPDKVVIVLNKIDLLQPGEIVDVRKKVRKALKAVGVADNSQIVEMSLADGHFEQESIHRLKRNIEDLLFEPIRHNDKSFLMAVDHCFSIKGKGVVMTGTVLQGTLRLSQEFEIPHLQEKRRPKSLESWKESVDEVKCGERAAMLVPNISVDSFSRTMIGAPGVLRPVRRCFSSVHPVSFFRSTLSSGTKMHISLGFETVMAECQFLRPQTDNPDEYEQLASMQEPCVVLLSFEKVVFVADEASFLMASRLDQQGKGCRFAFHGCVIKTIEADEKPCRFTRKIRTGVIERVEESRRSAICSELFKKETKFEIFGNMQVRLSSGEIGRIESSFGKSGKVRLSFANYLPETVSQKVTVELHMKKYLTSGKMVSYIP